MLWREPECGFCNVAGSICRPKMREVGQGHRKAEEWPLVVGYEGNTRTREVKIKT
jgi:hypothetical protein